ncbi:hypothetical protein [Bacillus cereus]|uniref:hypothetical protein n=1 Tax=Bacillus cereus TaxID=1396 RepID=UPI0020B17043|nr:hypothetical protein [Bacillus cereus]
MQSVILQPVGKGNFNFNSTMRNGISLSDIQPFLKEEEFEDLSQIYKNKNEKVHVWGIRTGTSNKREWNKIKRGMWHFFMEIGTSLLLLVLHIRCEIPS